VFSRSLGLPRSAHQPFFIHRSEASRSGAIRPTPPQARITYLFRDYHVIHPRPYALSPSLSATPFHYPGATSQQRTVLADPASDNLRNPQPQAAINAAAETSGTGSAPRAPHHIQRYINTDDGLLYRRRHHRPHTPCEKHPRRIL
jgi:hypothetical protein